MATNGTLVFVLNGPPRAGKDTGAEVLIDVFKEAEVYPFFRPIKELLHSELGLNVAYDFYEETKDQPSKDFNGMTPRQAYIDKGERLQAKFGHSILIDIYFESIAKCTAPVLITTCGNDGEACEMSNIFGNDNVLVMRIHKDGCDFSNDSRSWVTSHHLNLRDLNNVHGRLREYQSEVAALARQWAEARGTAADYAA